MVKNYIAYLTDDEDAYNDGTWTDFHSTSLCIEAHKYNTTSGLNLID